MANKIILKKSSVISKVPLAGDLEYGELALNYADGKLYYKKTDNTIDFYSASSVAETGAGFTASSSAPSSPVDGDSWLNTTTGIKYTYFNDGTSSQWVELDADISISSGSAVAASSYSNEYVVSGTTTNSTETEIFVDGVNNSRILVPANTTVYYTIDLVCRRTDTTGTHGAWFLKGVATNVAGTVTDVGALYEVIVVNTDSALAVDVRADDTNNSIGIYVTGATGKTISWRAAVNTVET